MGRPKKFNREGVLDRAIPVFWKHGFANTTVQDLEQATGVNKSGLYTEFKDKEDLFLASLERYAQTRCAETTNKIYVANNGSITVAVSHWHRGDGCPACPNATPASPRPSLLSISRSPENDPRHPRGRGHSADRRVPGLVGWSYFCGSKYRSMKPARIILDRQICNALCSASLSQGSS